MKKLTFGLFCFLFLGMAGCIKETPSNSTQIPLKGEKVAVLCEGNYMWNNAQLDIYYPDSNVIHHNVFDQVNGKPLGDVLQSGFFDGQYLWLSVNNTGKLVKISPKTFKEIKSKIGFKSPRYLAQHNGNMWITDILANKIIRCDTQNLNVLSELPCLPNKSGLRAGWSEEIVVWDNHIVAALYDGFLMKINPLNNQTNYIKVDTGAQYLAIDKLNRLWVASSVNGKASLTVFKANDTIPQFIIPFPLASSIQKLKTNPNKDKIYIILNGTLKSLDINASNYSDIVSFPLTKTPKNIYALGIHPRSGNIYIGDAKDYISNGEVFIFKTDGSWVSSFSTGIIPTDFVFITD
jgi:streptogramin lyase